MEGLESLQDVQCYTDIWARVLSLFSFPLHDVITWIQSNAFRWARKNIWGHICRNVFWFIHIQEVLMFWSSRLASPCLQSSSPLSWLNFFKWLSVRPMGNCQCFEGFGFPSKKELNVGTTGGCGLAVAWYGRNLGIRALFQALYGLKLCKGKS